MRRRALALLLVVAGLTSACGSSVLAERAGGAAGTEGSTQGVAAIPGQEGVAGVPGGTVVVTGPGRGTGAGGGAVAAPTGAAYELGVPGLTRGVTETTIKIGIPVLANAEAAAGLLGAANIHPGNNEVEAKALIADINKRGGINGRKLEPNFFDVDFGNPTNIEANVLAACNHFADDVGVFAILMLINPPAAFIACAAQKGVILLNGSLLAPDDTALASNAPWYYAPTLLSQDRLWAPLIDNVSARGLIQPGDKVGVFVLDKLPFTRVADKVVLRLLEQRGYDVVAVERVATEAGVTNAVLRFRQSGVTHVVFVQDSAVPDLLFMRQAEAQRFRPTYLMNSYDAPGYLLEGNLAQEQIAGVHGIGWMPLTDVKPDREPLRPEEVRCFQILTAGGEPQSKRQDFLTAQFMCDLVWVFEAISRAAGPELSTVTFRSGLQAVGGSYRPATAFSVDLSHRADGVSSFRPFGYVASCGCIQYLGPPEPLP